MVQKSIAPYIRSSQRQGPGVLIITEGRLELGVCTFMKSPPAIRDGLQRRASGAYSLIEAEVKAAAISALPSCRQLPEQDSW